LVQVFAHLEDQGQVAGQLARELDSTTERHRVKTLEMQIERGAALVFCLSMPRLTVDDSSQRLVWRGAPEGVQFSVTAPLTQLPQAVIGTLTVWLDTPPIGSGVLLPLGHIKFRLARAQIHKQQRTVRVGESARFYGQAFISYASQDFAEVVKRVQMLSMMEIPYFQDVLNLDPGQRWKQALYRYRRGIPGHRAPDQNQEQAAFDRVSGEVFLGDAVLAFTTSAIDDRDAMRSGEAVHAPTEAASHPHQVSVIEIVFGAVIQSSPPLAKSAS
jgi:hypothetical protein